MANTLLTTSLITKQALRIARNSNALIRNIDRQYDDQFGNSSGRAGKIGTTLRIRKPNDYGVINGAVWQNQATNENQIVLTVATQKHVPLAFTSVDLALSLEEFSERILAPAVNRLMGQVAVDVMSGTEGGVEHLAYSVASDGTTLVSPTLSAFGVAKAILDNNGAPGMDRNLLFDPFTQTRTTAEFAGLFNPQNDISKQYRNGEMAPFMGFDKPMMDQTVIKHTNGAYGTPATVSGGSQTGTNITTTALPGALNQGDVVTFDGVYGVNPVTSASTGALRQFAIQAPAAASATTVSIYPAIIPYAGGSFSNTPYQTVVASPANGAAMRLILPGGSTFRKNVAFYKEAATLVCADLPVFGKGVISADRESYDGLSMRLINFYDGVNDISGYRLDILYGYLWTRPEWAVAIADVV